MDGISWKTKRNVKSSEVISTSQTLSIKHSFKNPFISERSIVSKSYGLEKIFLHKKKLWNTLTRIIKQSAQSQIALCSVGLENGQILRTLFLEYFSSTSIQVLPGSECTEKLHAAVRQQYSHQDWSIWKFKFWTWPGTAAARCRAVGVW